MGRWSCGPSETTGALQVEEEGGGREPGGQQREKQGCLAGLAQRVPELGKVGASGSWDGEEWIPSGPPHLAEPRSSSLCSR